ncbi:type II toxin-antitoxin system VapC family toxin [Benzoatithermus flavus]|uniref:Type II toxin-antitoxin system VapC family toxin n=1 Tax=Benzoatithermus flavus TaxID=3108223 RepID=A0ABU8XXI4_9PROT
MRDESIAVSAITVWELTRKVAFGKLLPLPVAGGSLGGYLQARGFVPVPLIRQDAETANALPPIHKDPMDRMLIAQPLRPGATIISDDGMFQAYGVATLW